MKNLKRVLIAAVILGVTAGLIYAMVNLSPAKNGTQSAIEEGREEIAAISRDLVTHNETTTKKVMIIRETVAQNVAALTPDELVISVDEFLRRWRKYSSEPPEGSAGLGSAD
jgi:hypothetical protein